MPLYEYVCAACSRRFEKIQKFSDPAPDPCPHCGKGPVERQLSSPAIQFKGSGFYITDYAKKGEASSDGSGQDKGDNVKGEKGEKGDRGEKGDKSGKPEKSDAKGDSGSGGATKTEAAPAAPAAAPAKSTTDS
jgi:putative FmdB family regulatory protein